MICGLIHARLGVGCTLLHFLWVGVSDGDGQHFYGPTICVYDAYTCVFYEAKS